MGDRETRGVLNNCIGEILWGERDRFIGIYRKMILFVTMLVKRTLILVGVTTGLWLASCKKHQEVGAPPAVNLQPIGPTLYVGGVVDSNGADYGAYWKASLLSGNSAGPASAIATRTLVPNTLRITSIVASGEDVYMAGTPSL
jgi:hypothetical protein